MYMFVCMHMYMCIGMHMCMYVHVYLCICKFLKILFIHILRRKHRIFLQYLYYLYNLSLDLPHIKTGVCIWGGCVEAYLDNL